MTSKETIETAMKWSNGEPELCAEIAVYLDRLYETAYGKGFAAGVATQQQGRGNV